mgnify:CR=1 FL=1
MMVSFLLIVLCITFLSSAIIIIKYIDFAKFIIQRREIDIEPSIVKFVENRQFSNKNRMSNEEIIIDIPVKDVKVLNNVD